MRSPWRSHPHWQTTVVKPSYLSVFGPFHLALTLIKAWLGTCSPCGRRDSVVRPSLERPSPAAMLQLDPMLIHSNGFLASSGLTAFSRCRVDVHAGSCDHRITSHPGPRYGLPLCCMHRRSRGRTGLILTVRRGESRSSATTFGSRPSRRCTSRSLTSDA
jgi:hypothetical protein